MTLAIINPDGSSDNIFVEEARDQEIRKPERRKPGTDEKDGRRKPGTDDINFGGPRHLTKDSGWLNRPENIKSSLCDAVACTECTEASSCWHGAPIKGRLDLNVSKSNAHSRFVVEAWARCGSGGGKWVARVFTKSFKNGYLSIYIDGVLLRTIQDSQAAERWERGRRQFKHIRIPVTKDAHVRVEFVRRDSTRGAIP